MRSTLPKIVIIAGPNGAGKTTFAQEFLLREAGCPDFINADLIARGLSPFQSDRVAAQAGRIMLEQVAEYVRRRESFAFETTLSGRVYAKHIQEWRLMGYHVLLLFLSLPNPSLAVARVLSRVSRGGHDIPEATIRRRFTSGLTNFENLYAPIVDEWVLYENSGERPVELRRGKNR
jgi:predicted ABC-type ATPase